MTKTENPLILSLETCTLAGGISLLRGNEILGAKAGLEKSPHSVQLLSGIRQLLNETNLDLKEFDLLAAAVGPGSFTGLRIGLATAKALTAALKIPGFGISTLEAAASSSEKSGKILAVIPAGRNEFFAQFFYKSDAGEVEKKSEIKTYKQENLFQEIASQENLVLVSSRELFAEFSSQTNENQPTFQEFPENLAIWIGKTAYRNFNEQNYSQYTLNPIYARGADIGNNKNAK